MTSFEISLSNMCIPGYCKSLFCVRLMVICKKKKKKKKNKKKNKKKKKKKKTQLNTMVNIYSYKLNPPYDALFRGLRRLRKFGANRCKLREEFLFEVILGINFPSANHRTGTYQTKIPREGWLHNRSLQRVSCPQVVLFVSDGNFSSNF